jgi:hypothetical protein
MYNRIGKIIEFISGSDSAPAGWLRNLLDLSKVKMRKRLRPMKRVKRSLREL